MPSFTSSIGTALVVAQKLSTANVPFELVSDGRTGTITCKLQETLEIAVRALTLWGGVIGLATQE